MANKLKATLPDFRLVDDGVSTSLVLSLDQFPFPENSPGKVTAIVLGASNADVSSITFTSKTCTINFSTVPPGDDLIRLVATWDPN